MDFTRKPLDIQNEPACAKCYQIVIKRGGQNPQSRINTGDFGGCKSLPLAPHKQILIVFAYKILLELFVLLSLSR